MFLKLKHIDNENKEKNLVQLLSNYTEEKLKEITYMFESVLAKFFNSIDRKIPQSYWQIDDFALDIYHIEANVFRFRGYCYWLTGGEKCLFVKIDVSTSKEQLLYSYKFYPKHYDINQSLYIARTEKGWFLNN